jgi:hypothetical protein
MRPIAMIVSLEEFTKKNRDSFLEYINPKEKASVKVGFVKEKELGISNN